MHDAGVTLYDNVSPRRDHWLNVDSGLGGVQYSMGINKDEARVNFQLDRTSKEENKLLFDELQQRRAQLDTACGAPLSWRRMDSKKVSIIEFGAPFETHQRENWPAVIDWLVSKIRKLGRAQPVDATLQQRIEVLIDEEHRSASSSVGYAAAADMASMEARRANRRAIAAAVAYLGPRLNTPGPC